MKKQFTFVSIAGALAALALGACNLGVVPPGEALPGTPPDAGAPAPGEPAPLPAVDLSGVEAGATMLWYDNSLLVFVPGGEFTMGGDMPDNPVHTVQVDDLWAYKTKVTNDMYRLCVSAGACTPPAGELPMPDYLQPAIKDHPVVGVTWEQAQDYCTWMGARLPTEAEWEKIARGPDGNVYPWGDGAPGCDLLNYETCELGSTSRVYEYPDGQSHYQAADMAGSAHEWVSDWYGSNYYELSPEENPAGPESGLVRSVRGSSFRTLEGELASSRRYGFEPGRQRDDLGFRCVVAGDATGFAPFCQLSAYLPGLAFPFPGAPAGEPEELPSPEVGTCEAEPPTASTSSYCVDQGTGTGGATVTYSGELVDWDPGCVPGDSPIGCTGPDGTTLSITVCNHCSPPVGPMAVEIEPTCAPGYILVDGMCEFAGLPPGGGGCLPGWLWDPETGLCDAVLPLPESDLCPEGYSYHEAMACCLAAFSDPLPDFPGLPPHSYPGCPIGTFFDEATGTCLPERRAVLPVIEDCRDFPVALGYCADPGDDPGDDNGTCVDPAGCMPPPNCGGATPCCCP